MMRSGSMRITIRAKHGNRYSECIGKNSTDMLDSTVIFNIKDNIWTDTFVLPGINTGAIIGGVAVALVLLGIVGAVIYRRRNRKAREKEYQANKPDKYADIDSQSPSESDERNPQAITLDSLKYSHEPRHPEYITPQVQNDLFYVQDHAARDNNNPQFDPRLRYQAVPSSEQPRDPQFRMVAPQEDAYVQHGHPQTYHGNPRMVVVSPRAKAHAQELMMQLQQQQPLLQQHQLTLSAQQQRYLDELERLRIEYRQLENPNNANNRLM